MEHTRRLQPQEIHWTLLAGTRSTQMSQSRRRRFLIHDAVSHAHLNFLCRKEIICNSDEWLFLDTRALCPSLFDNSQTHLRPIYDLFIWSKDPTTSNLYANGDKPVMEEKNPALQSKQVVAPEARATLPHQHVCRFSLPQQLSSHTIQRSKASFFI